MTESVIRCLPSSIQRLLGVGALLNVVAVYSKTSQLPTNLIESWYNHAIDWMKNIGFEPRTLSFLGVKGFKDVDGYAFSQADKKLRKRGFDDLPHITLAAATPPGSSYWKPWETASLYNEINERKGGYSYMVWAWEHDNQELTKEVFLCLVKQLIEWNILDYAIAFQDYAKGYPPTIKATHSAFMRIEGKRLVSYSGKNIVDAINRGFHPLDFLREVYPYQILSTIHLAYPFGNQTLREWINSSDAHGTLDMFSEERWLWAIPDSQLDSIRKILTEHHLLTLYLPDMNRILEDYAQPLGYESQSDFVPIVDPITEQNISPKTDAIDVDTMRTGRPQKTALLEKLKGFGLDESHPGYNAPCPLVSLEDFFEGNDDYESIGSSIGPAELYNTLKQIRARPDVQDVLVEIYDIEVAFQYEAAWPYARRVYFYTTASKADIEEWNCQLIADGAIKVSNDKSDHINPPVVRSGYKTWYCIWT